MLKAFSILGFLVIVWWSVASPVVAFEVDESRTTEAVRGEYLVHHVAKCIECHTPRDSRGDLDRTKLLQGAPIPLESPFPRKKWAFQAPALAGLPGWSREELIHLLTSGKRFSGHKPNPPMPEYRMQVSDAKAVAAYLASLR